MVELGVYNGLFVSTFVAAALLPTASEAVLVGLLLTDAYSVAGSAQSMNFPVPTLKNRDLELLLPHNWRPVSTIAAPAATATVPATVAHGLAK